MFVKRIDIDILVFFNWYNLKMKMIRVYVIVIDGFEYFWC